jgi:serine/threonine-protein kinase
MEYIHGILLSKYLNNRVTVDLQWTLSVIRELALALNEIHEAGVIHRDFRPENVIIREDGGICVIDFGISSFREKEGLETIPVRVGSAEIRTLDRICIEAAEKPVTLKAVGTAVYSSPKQLSGCESGPEDDIYSFGITIFELLPGFRTQMEKAKAVQDLRKKRVLQPGFREEFPEAAKLVLAMTEVKEKLRPTVKEILNSEWLKF